MNYKIIIFIFIILILIFLLKNKKENFKDNLCPLETRNKCKNYASMIDVPKNLRVHGPFPRPSGEDVRKYVTKEGSCKYGISKFWWCGDSKQYWENQHGPAGVNPDGTLLTKVRGASGGSTARGTLDVEEAQICSWQLSSMDADWAPQGCE